MRFGYPGVYVEEAPSGAHAIAGVPTSTAAFLGTTKFGPVAAPLLVHSFAEFEARFGGLSVDVPLGYAVRHFFLNGGRDALIARVEPAGPALTDADLSDPALEQQRRGLWLLDHAERFNLLCIPPLSRTTDVGRATWDAAAAYAASRRAMVIVDPPAAWTTAQAVSETAITALAPRSPNASLYYPRLQAPDPLQGNQVAAFAPCGAVAGIYARVDGTRGVWKAPAGAEAAVLGVQGLAVALSQTELSALSALGVNGVRLLPAAGSVLWGARTLAGTDGAAPEIKYVPVRRLELFIEASLIEGLQWVVFEPNGEPLWARIRASVEAFLHDLFVQGALAGNTPDEAYFVRCDASTATRYDLDQGIVNVVVGFAPLRPAEFVIIGIPSSFKDQAAARFMSRRLRIRTGRYTLRVAWDGQVVKGVTRVRGIAQLTELVTVHQGGDPSSSQVIVGQTKFEPVTLERAVTRDDAFETWAEAIRASGPGGGAPPPRKDVRIELHDGERGQTIAWLLKGALPVKFQAPDLNAAGNDVAIEELTLAYESLAREDEPPA